MNSLNSRSIHRKLILRIFLLGLALSILVGAGVWQMEKDKIGQEILWDAKAGFKLVNNQIRTLLNTPDTLNPDRIRQHLVKAMEQRRQNRSGGFVSIGIYTLSKELVTLVTDDFYEYRDLVRANAGRFNDKGKPHGTLNFSIIPINNTPHIQLISPLNNDLGEIAAYGEAFFAVAPEILEQAETKAVKLAGAAVLIIMLTTGLVYPVVVSLLNRVSSLSAKLFESNLEMLKVLGSAVAKRDSDTDSHNYRVTIISVKLAEQLKLSKPKIQRLIKGAFLHDVGKIGIEDDILHKPGRLSEDEFTVMKNHVPYGIDIVGKAEWIKEATDIVAYHHEKFDGSGYGNGFKGDQIPQIARIFSIADVFDALTSRRPYKEPFPFEKAMDIIIAGRGNHFDPACVDEFEKIARPLFDAYARREDDTLKTELAALLKAYFYK